jgi:predicted metal-dependent hydrolase
VHYDSVERSTLKDHSDFYELGIDLFNQGRFFECHEAWEEVWKRADGEPKLFYQGLIQAAVAILHAQRGNLEGARSLYEKASAKLEAIPDEHMGLAIAELRTALAEFIEIAIDTNARPLPAPPRLRRI